MNLEKVEHSAAKIISHGMANMSTIIYLHIQDKALKVTSDNSLDANIVISNILFRKLAINGHPICGFIKLARKFFFLNQLF